VTPPGAPPFVIHANLDCEARWAGGALPGRVASRVSHYAALLAALAPGDRDVEIWAPAAIDPARLIAHARWTPPRMRVGAPPRADLAWARDDAKAANDRRLALEVARTLGVALPGARVVDTLDELDAAIRALAGSPRWVAKAPWTTAGRDRCHGEGAPTEEQRTRIARLLERFGALIIEPWLERVSDVGVCATVDARGDVVAEPAHGLVTDARGTFLGIELAPPALADEEHAQLARAVRAVGAALARLRYAGPFAIDAFVYTADGERRLHPLCEINARYTFGWIARALHQRLGATRLGFSAPPPGATVLIAPAGDRVTAWVA